tara:strand:- start:26 stop:493 length:468 start_codon:yes stop_codon:yes gene_type:complete
MKIFKLILPALFVMTFGCAAAPQQAESEWELIVPPVPTPEQLTTWYPGKFMLSQTICRSEEGIMKLLKADTESAEALMNEVIKLHLDPNSDCMRLPRPAAVMIMGVTAEYRDHRDVPSVALQISLTPKGPLAFALATGKWSNKPPEEEKTKKIAV